MKEMQIIIETTSKNGWKGKVVTYALFTSQFGRVLIATSTRGICFIAFVNDNLESTLNELKTRFPDAEITEQSNKYQQEALECIDNPTACTHTLKLHLTGTEFQLKVWEELLNIPFGTTTFYSQIAQAIHRPKAVRAVGSAIGKNPISYIIPCHRVIRATGKLGEYHWGKEVKERILEYETSTTNKL